jgi:hypothetical protein
MSVTVLNPGLWLLLKLHLPAVCKQNVTTLREIQVSNLSKYRFALEFLRSRRDYNAQP